MSVAGAQQIELVDGDRVIMLGSTLIERDAEHGYLETWLTSRWPARNIVFRNLGWSGDTVRADARAGFDTAHEGFARMTEQIRGLEPTWILVAYGANESFTGKQGLAEFRAGLNRLLDTLAATSAKLALVTPHRHEALGPPLPDPAAHNENVSLYAEAIRQVADERKLPLLALERGLNVDEPQPLTDNGLHLTDYGYWRYASALAASFQVEDAKWMIELQADGTPTATTDAQLSEVEANGDGLRFTVIDERLPCPPCPAAGATSARDPWPGFERVLRIGGLEDGRYELRIDGQPVASGTASDWAQGVTLTAGPEFVQVEQLRDAIRQKNQLYFHRWRPQNDTYLLGFRKHEQGQNAIEIPEFDPLVAQQEAVIASLRRPVTHRYELTRTVRPAVETGTSN